MKLKKDYLSNSSYGSYRLTANNNNNKMLVLLINIIKVNDNKSVVIKMLIVTFKNN